MGSEFLLKERPSRQPRFDDLYPERKPGKEVRNSGFLSVSRRSVLDRCCFSVQRCLDEMPLVRLMMGALRSHGCIPDGEVERYVSCDVCAPETRSVGGYDDVNNQVFLCANAAGGNPGKIHGELLRGLIAMFDACTNNYDFRGRPSLGVHRGPEGQHGQLQPGFRTGQGGRGVRRPEPAQGVRLQHRRPVHGGDEVRREGGGRESRQRGLREVLQRPGTGGPEMPQTWRTCTWLTRRGCSSVTLRNKGFSSSGMARFSLIHLNFSHFIQSTKI